MKKENEILLAPSQDTPKEVFISHDRKNIREVLEFPDLEFMGAIDLKPEQPED